MAASDNNSKFRRLFMKDRISKIGYLIDTGSDVSVYPHSMIRDKPRAEAYQLYAANGSEIKTYGTLTLQPDFGLRRAFPWRFIIAEVLQPIIGANFLAHYHLLLDMRRKKLIDGTTGLAVQGLTARHAVPSIKTIAERTRYQDTNKIPGDHDDAGNNAETETADAALHQDDHGPTGGIPTAQIGTDTWQPK